MDVWPLIYQPDQPDVSYDILVHAYLEEEDDEIARGIMDEIRLWVRAA